MIGDVLDQYASKTGRVFKDRERTIGASEIGQCARKVFWLKNGGARDDNYVDNWGAALRGSTFENAFWLPAMRARYGDKLRYAGEQQATIAHEFLSATPDGLLVEQPRDALAEFGVADIGRGGAIVVECKTIDPRARLDTAKQQHAFQVQVQLGLFRKATEYRPDYGALSYTDSSFWDETTEFVIARDPRIFANAEARARQIMTAKAATDLKPEGWIAGGNECRTCPFTKACGRERTAIPDDLNGGTDDPKFIAEMTELAQAAKQHEAAAEASQCELREIQNEIRERLRNKQTRRVVTDTIQIIWSPVRGRPAFDIPAIRTAAAAAGVDITRFETVGDPTDRLTVQVLNEGT